MKTIKQLKVLLILLLVITTSSATIYSTNGKQWSLLGALEDINLNQNNIPSNCSILKLNSQNSKWVYYSKDPSKITFSKISQKEGFLLYSLSLDSCTISSETIQQSTQTPPVLPNLSTDLTISDSTDTSATGLIGQEDCSIADGSKNVICIYIKDSKRYIKSNGIPDHETGIFPNKNNPNTISKQEQILETTAIPTKKSDTTNDFTPGVYGGERYIAGVIVNGIWIEPFTAERFINPSTGEKNEQWSIDAYSPNHNLGLDKHNAHVQPTGKYHYHGAPTGLVKNEDGSKHSKIYGWAGDGFPIYYKYVYEAVNSLDNGIVALKGSYRLRNGIREGDGVNSPDGKYDGTYVQDWQYSASFGELDKCNGRFGVTPEFPQGTYYYVMTDNYPYTPRCFGGTPDKTFQIGQNRNPLDQRPPNGQKPPKRKQQQATQQLL